MITVVDLGDTSHLLGPFVMSTSEDPHVDQSLLLFTHMESPAPVVDLTRRSKVRELLLHCSNPKSSLRGGPGFKDTLVATAQETAASHSFGQTKLKLQPPNLGLTVDPSRYRATKRVFFGFYCGMAFIYTLIGNQAPSSVCGYQVHWNVHPLVYYTQFGCNFEATYAAHND